MIEREREREREERESDREREKERERKRERDSAYPCKKMSNTYFFTFIFEKKN